MKDKIGAIGKLSGMALRIAASGHLPTLQRLKDGADTADYFIRAEVVGLPRPAADAILSEELSHRPFGQALKAARERVTAGPPYDGTSPAFERVVRATAARGRIPVWQARAALTEALGVFTLEVREKFYGRNEDK
jgi:hypothetical protein